MKKQVYSGFLSVDPYGCLCCGDFDNYLLADIADVFKPGEKIFVCYFIADRQITVEEASEALLVKMLGGNVDALDFVLDAYSEWTILDYNEEMVIGGHDLYQELLDAEGKYLLMLIESREGGEAA